MWDLGIFDLNPQHMHGGEGVPKCVIFGVRSIFEVQFLSEKFSLDMVMVGQYFSRYNVHARKPYE